MAKIIISDLDTAELEKNYGLNELSTEEMLAIHGGGLLGRIIGSTVGGVVGFFLGGPGGIISGIGVGGALGDEIQDAL